MFCIRGHIYSDSKSTRGTMCEKSIESVLFLKSTTTAWQTDGNSFHVTGNEF